MIAVMGAAGNVGSKVVDLLLLQNEKVRVLEHRRSLDQWKQRGAHVVSGNAVNVDDLLMLFKDADAALVLLPENLADPHFVATRSTISRAIARALHEQRVGHVVALSAVGTDQENVAGPPAGLREWERRLFEHQGINLLVLRSAFYMDNLLANLPLIESQLINGSAIKGDVAFPMIATQDVACEAADRLARRDFTGHQAKLLLGPEDVTMREATQALGARLGRPDLPYVKFPPAGMKDALIGAGMSEEAATLIVDMQLALNEGRPFGRIQRTADAATPTRLSDFLEHALAQAQAH